ncbi:branched-chain amino acid ABC transporter substrate-binding protein [Chryseobacterium sp. SSA4.19]|uniref:hypothetical protein n=1 Tax=Chryseobacterium sp. SSA4.19 TaxID=2919915 RepID=UPI001F4D9ADE|nr:hypothetical protein [Chryseobacterium sp. SSA4.19]MCJ8153347.1 branched-chain amino acid ABC transporter substrate-binding protein [Chryseobacterium sp. SSA4.19]
MPFDFLDGLGFLADLLTLDFSDNSSKKIEKKKEESRKSKYTTELWSGGFLLIASILYFTVFKNPLPGDYLQTLFICSFAGLIISFAVFFSLFHLRLFYFKSLSKLLLFSCSFVLLSISGVFYIYFNSGIFV